ncbi:MAG: molybdenum cofactor biosynthesis protein MoaE [Paracoccaceae bacterium]
MRVGVQEGPFDYGAECAAFAAGQTASAAGAGAVVTFLGIVRGEAGRLSGIEIEHYPGMTDRAIRAILDEAAGRWPLDDALVIHRYGRLAAGEPIMMVATASRHRAAAFGAAEFLMDYLKSRAPFWKKELGEGAGGWVEAKAGDEVALRRW